MSRIFHIFHNLHAHARCKTQNNMDDTKTISGDIFKKAIQGVTDGKSMFLCGDCKHFGSESVSGAGYCDVLDSAWCYCDSCACGKFERKGGKQ